MVSPKYENGQVVFYKPIGGPNSDTAESTGIITDILMEPGQQANMNVNASAAQPRYEIQNYNTGNTTSSGEKERRIGKKRRTERATVESEQRKEQRIKGGEVRWGKERMAEGRQDGTPKGGRSGRRKRQREGANGREKESARQKEQSK
ncbi:hypothetical protein O988_06089 [Pseudogymnoascus sp. VKM F-3808]|nr:hypothetical protein O988_06089 [Pseudogymnoascus sp. VKM F-3808]